MLTTRVDLSFEVHKLAKFSSNPGKLHCEGLVHLLIYIRDNTNVVLTYYSDIKYAPLFDLLRRSNIKTKNQLMVLYDSSFQDYIDTVRSTGAYIIFYQGGPIDYGTHDTGPVAQSIAEIGYSTACNSGMALAHFRMLIHELFNKDPDSSIGIISNYIG